MLVLTVFFVLVVFHGGDVYAVSVSGDEVCGGSVATECGVKDLAKIVKGILGTIIAIGLPLLVVFIMYRFVMAWYALQQGNANAYKEATQKVGQAILGFIIIVALMGGIFFTMLKFLGVKDFPLQLLKTFSQAVVTPAYAAPFAKGQCPQDLGKMYSCITDANESGYCDNRSCLKIRVLFSKPISKGTCSMSSIGVSCTTATNATGVCSSRTGCEILEEAPAAQPAPVPATQPTVQPPVAQPTPQAPAATQTQLPNPFGVDNLYDFILSVLNLIMRFFIYPALIAMWVWSGFSYVLAQGAPEKIAKTHKLLWWAFVSTLLVFMTQAFLIAVRGSVQKIISTNSITRPISAFESDNNIILLKAKS